MASIGGAAINPSGGWLRDVLRFPYRKFEIDTELSQEQVLERLRAIVEPGSSLRAGLKRTNKLFAGEISQVSFKIRRLKSYPNSNLPVVTGRIEASPLGTRVEIAMRLRRFVQVFVGIWSALMAVALVTPFLFRMYSYPNVRAHFFGPVEWVAMVLSMTAFAMLTIGISFGLQARKARGLLEQAFRTDPGPSVQKVLDAPPPRLPRFARNALAVAAALIAFFSVIQISIARSEPCRVAERYVRSDSVVRSELGAVRDVGLDPFKSAHIKYSWPGNGDANFALRVEGSRSKGVVLVNMLRHQGVWRVSSANLRESDGRVIELQADAASTIAPGP
jgi:hypothetical protein